MEATPNEDRAVTGGANQIPILMPFQVLLPISKLPSIGGEYQPGDVINREDLPLATDFERLVRLKVLRPTEGEPEPIRADDTEGHKDRADRLQKELDALNASGAIADGTENLTKENERLNGVVADLRKKIEDTAAKHAAHVQDIRAKAQEKIDGLNKKIIELKAKPAPTAKASPDK